MLCLILTVAFTVYSCRTDHIPEKEAYNNSSKFQLTSKMISLNESKHRSILLPKLEKAKTGINAFSKTNINGRVIDYGNGVSIDTDDVIYIENGPNYHTYTFYIKRENALPNDPLENLVLTPLTDGTYRELLVSYDFTPQEKEIVMNGGFVNTKGKTTITELAVGTYSPLSKGSSCGWKEETVWVSCSSTDHHQGNIGEWVNCTADIKPRAYVTYTYKCEFLDDVDNPTPGSPSIPPYENPGGPADGGGVPGTGDCDSPGILTGPQDPSSGIGEGGCDNGVPSIPNLPNPKNTPCAKTKTLLEDPAVTAKVGTLKEKSKIKKKQPGYGESAVEINNDGTTSDIIPGGDHEVKLESSAGKKGAYHNHTPEGVKMFSPADILSMLTYSLTQPIGNLNNGFLGMVGTEKCGTCPDGYKYHNYIIRFSGNSQELEKYLFQTNWDEDALDVDYEKRVYGLRDNPLYVNEYGRLNNNGLQKLFFDTLKSMKMEGKVTLQKIEDNGLVQNIVLDNAGNPSPILCP